MNCGKAIFALIVIAFSWPFLGGIFMFAINFLFGAGSIFLIIGAGWMLYVWLIAPFLASFNKSFSGSGDESGDEHH